MIPNPLYLDGMEYLGRDFDWSRIRNKLLDC